MFGLEKSCEEGTEGDGRGGAFSQWYLLLDLPVEGLLFLFLFLFHGSCLAVGKLRPSDPLAVFVQPTKLRIVFTFLSDGGKKRRIFYDT